MLLQSPTKVGPSALGLSHPSISPYGAYPTADKSMVLISIQNEQEFSNLCSLVLGQPELPSDPRFSSNVSGTL